MAQSKSLSKSDMDRNFFLSISIQAMLLGKKLIIIHKHIINFSKSEFSSARIHNSNCTARISQKCSNKFSVTIVFSLAVSQLFLCRSFKQLLQKKTCFNDCRVFAKCKRQVFIELYALRSNTGRICGKKQHHCSSPFV